VTNLTQDNVDSRDVLEAVNQAEVDLIEQFKFMQIAVMAKYDLNEVQLRTLKDSSTKTIRVMLNEFKNHLRLIESLAIKMESKQ
jgi:hypothetical protein